jgi:ubiquitin-protein ligase
MSKHYSIMENTGIINGKNIRRLVHDVKTIITNPLTSNGIYYVHSDINMYKGYALIIGPTDTPYEDGFYLFEFIFPTDYPYSPPSLKYCTSDGATRFNPNLYRNGKVCVSILNTWKGEQWTSCQNISSILLTLSSLFNNNPLTNEPGFGNSPYCEQYRECIQFMNYETAIIGMVNNTYLPKDFQVFYLTITEHFEKHKNKIAEKIHSLINSKYDNMDISFNLYKMKTVINYEQLYTRINNI